MPGARCVCRVTARRAEWNGACETGAPMRSRALPFVSLLALVVLAAPAASSAPPSPATRATAAVGPTSSKATRIDPAIGALFGFRRRTGLTAFGYVRSERFEREGVLPVVIRFAHLDATKAAALGRAGVEELAPTTSGAYTANVGEAQLAALAADPDVLKIACDLPVRAPLPLDASAKETGIAYARRALRAKDGTLLDGTGVKIADIDSGVFAFHPNFFKADGGVYAWTDVNGDGELTPGVDGVDLDQSGAIEDGEKLQILSAQLKGRASGFDPALDWVYVDTNGNGARDFGKSFGESTPAYGEPIFVVDDVDQDGKVGLAERLLRLGSSKIAAAKSTRTWTRGNANYGIAAFGQQIYDDSTLLEWAGHGTGVAGILVGGVADRTRLLGLAPGAELLAVGYGSQSPSGTVASIQWAINQKADIILTEYAPYTGYPLDGSSEEEALLASAVDAGIAVVDPAGNLSTGYKHRSVHLAAGDNAIKLKTDVAFKGAYYVAFTLLHRGDPRTLGLKLQLPDGSSVDVPTESTTDPVSVGGDRYLQVIRRTTERGTQEIHLQLYALDSTMTKPGVLPSGAYGVTINADAELDAELYCSDDKTSWAQGLTFEENTPTRTVCHPATNDKGIAVAAYTLHDLGWGPVGQLASYSSIGPRLDGAPGIGLAAPDDPTSTAISAAGSTAITYEPFGGTSGAGPHVAAALALLKQANPTLGAAALQQKLLDSARKDSFVTDDATRWGKGKLDVAAAFGVARTEGTPPVVTLQAPSDLQATRPIELTVTVADAATDLRARWDLDDDGTFDTGWEPMTSNGATKTITLDAPAIRDVRVDVLDGAGYVRGATKRLVVGPWQADPAPASDATNGSSGCGCSTPARDNGAWAVALPLLVTFQLLRRRRRTPR